MGGAPSLRKLSPQAPVGRLLPDSTVRATATAMPRAAAAITISRFRMKYPLLWTAYARRRGNIMGPGFPSGRVLRLPPNPLRALGATERSLLRA